MKKARLIVKGNVQTVGYRAYIKLAAQNLNINGSTRNLNDGTVEIYCECDADIYKRFKTAINRKATDKTDLMQINVEEIKEFDEKSDGFDCLKIKTPFEIVYDGLEMTRFERESLERSEMAILAMTSMNENLGGKQDKMLEKQDKMLEKQDQTLTAIKDMDQHMNENFNRLDEKYDKFSLTLARIEVDIKEMKDSFKKLVDYLTKNK